MQEFKLLTRRGERRKIRARTRDLYRDYTAALAVPLVLGYIALAVGLIFWTVGRV